MPDGTLAILGPDGAPLAPSRASKLAGAGGASSAKVLTGGTNGVAYDAADVFTQHFAGWQPFLWSPDNEINVFRDRIVARIRDLVRNDGWAAGTVTRVLDNAVGAVFRPLAKPDWR